MGYTASHHTLTTIADLVVEERPEWEHALVLLILRSHTAIVDGTDLAVAALRAAQNRNYLTPKAIGWRGPHWQGLATKPVEAQSRERCGVCGRTEPECASVRPGGDDHRYEPTRDLRRR